MLMHKKSPTHWTDDHKKIVTILSNAGISRNNVSIIFSHVLNKKITKNSIVGLCNRIGLSNPIGLKRKRTLLISSESLIEISNLIYNNRENENIFEITHGFVESLKADNNKTASAIPPEIKIEEKNPNLIETKKKNNRIKPKPDAKKSKKTTNPPQKKTPERNQKEPLLTAKKNEITSTIPPADAFIQNKEVYAKDAPIDYPESIPLLRLKTRSCRWAIGTTKEIGQHLFCGKQSEIGQPYCHHHAQLAYTPRPPNKEKKVNSSKRTPPKIKQFKYLLLD